MRRLVTPVRLVVVGALWIVLTWTTCSIFHVDPVPGATDFDPERNSVLVLYQIMTIRGVSFQTANLVLSSLFAVGAALVLAGLILGRSRRQGV